MELNAVEDNSAVLDMEDNKDVHDNNEQMCSRKHEAKLLFGSRDKDDLPVGVGNM